MKRYFIPDSKKGLSHIKKNVIAILSKVIAILRRHNDIIFFLGKIFFQECHNWKYIKFFFLIFYYQIVFVSGIICFVKNISLVECGMLMIILSFRFQTSFSLYWHNNFSLVLWIWSYINYK